jgi:nucleoside-triphosphatase
MSPRAKNLLLTGEPACGKTTIVRRVVERLGDLRLAGFYTEEVRRQGRRLGFQAIGLHGRRATLAHILFAAGPRVGRYGVDVKGFEAVVADELEQPPGQVDLFVIDEIGKMECYSERFIDATRTLLDGPLPVLTTVGHKGRGFLSEVKTRRDIRLITVTRENRDALPERLERELRRLVGTPR